jgi:hypothetical protein
MPGKPSARHSRCVHLVSRIGSIRAPITDYAEKSKAPAKYGGAPGDACKDLAAGLAIRAASLNDDRINVSVPRYRINSDLAVINTLSDDGRVQTSSTIAR